MSFCFAARKKKFSQALHPGVISRGLRGQNPFVKIIDHFGGSAALKILDWPWFSKFIDLASKAFSIAMINYALLRDYRDISNC